MIMRAVFIMLAVVVWALLLLSPRRLEYLTGLRLPTSDWMMVFIGFVGLMLIAEALKKHSAKAKRHG